MPLPRWLGDLSALFFCLTFDRGGQVYVDGSSKGDRLPTHQSSLWTLDADTHGDFECCMPSPIRILFLVCCLNQ